MELQSLMLFQYSLKSKLSQVDRMFGPRIENAF